MGERRQKGDAPLGSDYSRTDNSGGNKQVTDNGDGHGLSDCESQREQGRSPGPTRDVDTAVVREEDQVNDRFRMMTTRATRLTQ